MNLKSRQYHHYITASCLSLFVGGIMAYMYFLSVSVVHVVMRKEVLQDINQLRSEIAYLESSYIEAHHKISTRVAKADGFNEVKGKIFVVANPETNLVLRTSGE